MRLHERSNDALIIVSPVLYLETGLAVVHVTDSLFLAREGMGELGALALASAIIGLAMAPLAGLAGTFGALIGRKRGRRASRRAARVSCHTMALLIVLGLVSALGLRAASGWLAATLPTTTAIASEVGRYVRVAALGLVFRSVGLAFGFLAVPRLHARPRAVAASLLASTNLCLDYCLISGRFGLPRLEMGGAAWATVAGEAAASLYLVSRAWGRLRRSRRATARQRRLDRRLTRVLLFRGFPASLRGLVGRVRWLLFFAISAWLGGATLAASNALYCLYAILRVPGEASSALAGSAVAGCVGPDGFTRIGGVMRRAVMTAYLGTLPLAALVMLIPGLPLWALLANDAIVQPCLLPARMVAASMAIVVPARLCLAAIRMTGELRAAVAIECMAATVALVQAAMGVLWPGPTLLYVWLSLPLETALLLVLSYSWIRAEIWHRLSA